MQATVSDSTLPSTVAERIRPAALKLCVVSFKPCWQDSSGQWVTSGGFPHQMRAIASMFGEVVLVILRSAPGEGGMPLPEGSRVVGLPEPFGEDGRRKLSVLFRIPYYLFHISRHVIAADAVHVPVPGDISLLGMILAFVFRKPTIIRYCSSWPETHQTTRAQRFSKWLMRRFKGGRNVMLVTGAGDTPPADGLHWVYSTSLTRAEMFGIEPVLERPLQKPARYSYLGRLSPEKGVETLIRAMAQLKQTGHAAMPMLTIVGDGPQRGELESLVVELSCGEHIRFVSQVDRPTLFEILLATDVCVQPSLTEGYAKAWLDALAHGVPVIGCLVSSAPELLGKQGERGWIVPPADVDSLSEALKAPFDPDIDWPALRKRCRTFSEDMTLESWAVRIGELTARQWNIAFRNGRLER